MQLAAKENQPSSVDFLLTAGADLILNNDKLGLMSVVIGCNNEDVAMAIISHDRLDIVMHHRVDLLLY